MTSINFKVIGLTRPGFKSAGFGLEPTILWIPKSPRTGGVRSTRLATPNGQYIYIWYILIYNMGGGRAVILHIVHVVCGVWCLWCVGCVAHILYVYGVYILYVCVTEVACMWYT